ncbi:MAG: outer membrane protein insertion porin family [Pyrinomonadaceae bacterium]|nr:outer membrane protein insertion porin family [Pyrinomonadaceae bacterium]MDQ1613645.1 outer membrane protein insertion porin family [Pyrinomonadaceae bacterium]MDX6270482.1 outer membrane protein insertion porin family [Acidobacteriota bacterium]
MRINAPLRRFLLAALMIGQTALLNAAFPTEARAQEPSTAAAPAAQSQKLVESVDIQGNRRNRDEDLLYYVTTRAGDPFNPDQVARDLKALNDLNFFNKTKSRVLTLEGPRGGVEVIFEVEELPVIRDLQFTGLSSISESDVLKAFRERRIGVQKENLLDPVKINNATRVIKELLAASGHPNATVNADIEKVSESSSAVTFKIDEGDRVRVVEIEFEGNKNFKDGELRGAMKYVKEAGFITRFKSQDILDREKLEVDLRLVRNYMAGKGYLQARAGEPRVEGLGRRRTGFPILPLPLLSSTDEALRITIPIIEGKVYRLGELKIEGNSIFDEKVIRAVIGLQKGDVASGERIYKGLIEDLKKLYGNNGFIQYTAEPEPTYKDNPANPNEGIADYTITIDEGKQFTLRRLEFTGNTFTRDNVLRREFVLNEGDIYNQSYVEYSVLRLNQLGFFDPVDKDKDVDFRQNEEEGLVDVSVKVQERGRQQISFNGGLSGIGGSFFGLDYSTNNLLGRGESLSLNFAAGNRQQSFVFSFTEPQIRNRPISAGFSLFVQSLKFFGEGTFLSQNANALQGLSGSQLDFLNTGDENLFTQRTAGASFFATAPLSEFYKKRPFTLSTRIGLSYSISQTSVRDPEVNTDPANPQNVIPVIYRQPNILTSRLTPSVVYDSRDVRGVDAINGKQIALQFAFAGLGGDVRTFQPSLTYQQFIPIRNKRSNNPHVFGFRLLAGHVGAFATSAKIREAQSTSLSFIQGVPVYERFFLGDEFTIRGYNVRSISPIVPIDQFVTSRNVVLATNSSGAAMAVDSASLQALTQQLGTFTGPGGGNVIANVSRGYQPIGADTQLLGNFEYRVPIFGPVSMAGFADIGSAFNLRKGADQIFSTSFQLDNPFLASQLGGLRGSLSGLVLEKNPFLASQISLDPVTGFNVGLVSRDNRLVTREELDNAVRFGPTDPITGLPFGFQRVFVRGEAQTNTAVRLSQSVFDKIGDFRSSLGLELRVQLPVVNVPLRLIGFYNPRARRGVVDNIPLFFQEERIGYRFSIGRTF